MLSYMRTVYLVYPLAYGVSEYKVQSVDRRVTKQDSGREIALSDEL